MANAIQNQLDSLPHISKPRLGDLWKELLKAAPPIGLRRGLPLGTLKRNCVPMSADKSEEHDTAQQIEALGDLQRVLDDERKQRIPDGVPEWKPEQSRPDVL